MIDAKNYLDNLSIAIRTYAIDQQRKLQNKNLNSSREKGVALKAEGLQLEQSRQKIVKELSYNNTVRKNARLLKMQFSNRDLIAINFVAIIKNNKDIDDQMSALALLDR